MNKINPMIELNKYIIELIRNNNVNRDQTFKSATRYDYVELLKPLYNMNDYNIMHFRDELLKRKDIPYFIHKIVTTEGKYNKLLLSLGSSNFNNIYTCGLEKTFALENNRVCETLKIDENTLFNLSYVSIIFTIILLYYLEENGVITFSDNITNHCPDYKEFSNLTIENLINRLSYIDLDDNNRFNSLFKFIKKELYNSTTALGDTTFTFYSTIILKDIIESVTNKKYNDLVNDIILKPNGMTSTFFDSPDITFNDYESDFITQIYKNKYNNATGHDGYFSTANDMKLLANSLINNTFLASTSFFDTCNYFNNSANSSLNKIKDNINEPSSNLVSSKTFKLSGKNGVQFIVDPLNKCSVFIGSTSTDRTAASSSDILSLMAIEESLLYNYLEKFNHQHSSIRIRKC